jgi:ribonuclease R
MKKKIISFFKNNTGREFKSKDIAKRLGFTSEHEYSSLKAVLHQLYEEGFLVKSGKKFRLNRVALTNLVKGTLQIVNGSYGFVVHDNSQLSDIFISARNLGTAFGGDIVEVVLFAKQKGKNIEGQIIKVVKRKREEIVGTLKKSKAFYFVEPDDPEVYRDIYVEKEDLNGASEGDKVVVGKVSWDSSLQNPEGKIIEVIGKAGSYDAEITSIAREFNLIYKFPPAVLHEANEIELKIPQEEVKHRKDYRNKVVFTIDPEDAKDFDDALSIEELDNGNFSIGVHIADVSHYVKEGSAIDKHALKRGNSVYLVGKVIPMLPEKLSNYICSLVPNEDRLTYSVIVELTKRGRVIGYEISKSIIKSKRRFTYEEVQEIILKKEGDYSYEILLLNQLAQTLRKKRLKEGSIEFSTPEVKFELDNVGKPIKIFRKEIKESNMLVEEFMLLANQITAKHIGSSKSGNVKPFIYRVHDLPDNEKLIEFARLVKSLGYSFNPKAQAKFNQFQSLLNNVKGKEEEEALVNEMAIRSMAKAIYSVNNIGHYGLGFKYYTHFTSPIRRYSDLIVHRLLHKYIDSDLKTNYNLEELDSISNYISDCERKAIDAERFSVKLMQTEFLQHHIGEEFHAIISGIVHFGVFVKLTENLAEGLVRLRDMEGDFYVYDEKKYALIGRSTKKQFRLGDHVEVKLIRADLEKSELDFIILE